MFYFFFFYFCELKGSIFTYARATTDNYVGIGILTLLIETVMCNAPIIDLVITLYV